jgi:cytochrome c
MIKFSLLTTIALLFSAPVLAADAQKGEKDFRTCRACHTISNGDEVIYKGGKTGPNLYGIIGQQAGTYPDYKYGDDLVAAGEAGLVWTEDLLVAFVSDPKSFLTEQLGTRARSRMSFRKKDASDIIAYLAEVGPAQSTLDASEDDELLETPLQDAKLP